jgi:tRNA(Ile)-lysidine synthase
MSSRVSPRIEPKLKQFLSKEHLLSKGDRVLVAVSGGPDSVALLHLLLDLRDELSLHLEVAHLQHGIRGKEAQEDARFVGGLARQLQLPFHLKEVNLPRLKAAAGKGNLEALGRSERYRFFATVARERNLDKIATAHTRDDQAETVLMWLLRGSGMKGLGGMAPVQRLNIRDGHSSKRFVIIRPLLAASKAEVLRYLEEKGLGYRLDSSNQERNFLRNWIRLELIPQLEARTDAHLRSRLAQNAELIRDEEQVLDELAHHVFKEIVVAQRLDRSALLKQNKAIQRRLLRLWIEETRGHLSSVDFDHVETLLTFIAQGTPQGRLSIPGGWELVKEYGTLRLERRWRRVKRAALCYNYIMRAGTDLFIEEAGVTIQTRKMLRPFPRLPDHFAEAFFDMACLPTDLTIRNFRRGDRFQPLGMTGHKKLKELFIENKIPLSVRANLPLLVLDDEVLWVPGYGRSETGKVRAETRAILQFKAVPHGS